jgi:hypothetical protein
MAFWNPAEMIGDAPHPLDYSLYDLLVTQKSWNDGIEKLGYYSTQDNLMTKIGVKPFIKVDTAFAALTPQTLDNKLRDKLVKYYHDKLDDNNVLHDKIEFEICETCYDFCTSRNLLKLQNVAFQHDEIARFSEALFYMTLSIIREYESYLANDIQSLTELANKFSICEKRTVHTTAGDISTLSELLQDIRELGVTPFARQARCAFIARSLCLSAIDAGIISTVQSEAIRNREYFKFIFSKSLSYAIEMIALIGARFDLTREQMSYLSIENILSIASTDALSLLMDRINENRLIYETDAMIILPSVISKAIDFDRPILI